MPSENKRDSRTIEQVLADSRAKKQKKSEDGSAVPTDSQDLLPSLYPTSENTQLPHQSIEKN